MIHYRGYKIDVQNDEQYEIWQGKKLVATGFGFSHALAHAKELIDADFVTPLLLILREMKEAEVAAAKERLEVDVKILT